MLKENLYLLEKLQFLLDFRKKHLEDTLQKDKFLDLLQLEGKDGLKSKILNRYVLEICKQVQIMKMELKKDKLKEKTSYTLEYLLKNKLMIWKDKFNLLNKKLSILEKTQMISSLFQILALELILTKKEQTFYWITQCLEQSGMLSSLTKTDYQDLDLIYSKQLLLKEGANSQCLTILKHDLQSKNSLKTCSQSFISSHVDRWESGVTKTENVSIKTLKFRIYPNQIQKLLFKDYANAFKFVYNKTLNHLKNEKLDSKISKIDLRDLLVTEKTRKHSNLWNKCNSQKFKLSAEITKFKKLKIKKLKDYIQFYINSKKAEVIKNQYDLIKKLILEIKQELHEFEKKASKGLRTIAVNEAFTSWKTNADMVLKKKKLKFTMKYKTKKLFRKQFTFGLTPNMFNIKDDYIYITDRKLKDKKIKIGKKSLKSLYKTNDLKQAEIVYKDKKYYIHLCVCLKKDNISSKKIVNAVGLDPGVCTFLSGFGTKETVKYQQSDKLELLNKKIDLLKSNRLKKFTKRGNKKSKRRVLRRIETKKLNIVDNLHWQIINDLCKSYEIICLEKFSSKQCVESNSLSRYSKRRLNDFKHFQFRQRLTTKANNQGIELILVNPYMTSKFCSGCGEIKYNLSLTDRIYKCSSCSLSICRDLNACKNILMFGLASKN